MQSTLMHKREHLHEIIENVLINTKRPITSSEIAKEIKEKGCGNDQETKERYYLPIVVGQ
jgi:hypothetical protein